MTNAPDGAFTPAEGEAILDMTEWASAYRDLRWVIPSMPWRHDSLAGLPVERTNFPGRLDLIGRRSRFGEPCVLCTLHRTPDEPRVEGIPEAVVERPTRAPRGVDWGRLASMTPMRIPVAAGLALLASAPAALASPAPEVRAVAVAVQPASMPGLMPDPGPSGWGAVVAHPVPAAVPADPDVGGEDSNDGFHSLPGQPGVPDLNRPLDPTEGDLKDDHTQAGRGATAGVSPPASLDSVIPPAGQGLDAAGGSDGSGNPYAPAQVGPVEVVGGGHKLELRKETREVPAEVESGDDEQDDSAAEVAEVAPVEAAPEPAPEPVPMPMPLPEPVEPPVTEAPPAPAAPLPIEAAEVAPVESEVTPERPAGVQDPADLREAAGHYRTAADLLDEAAAEIEAGDAALAGESEVPTGQGGGDTAEDGAGGGTGTEVSADGDAEVSNVDLEGARVEVKIGGLELKVNGQTEEVDLSINGEIEVNDNGTATVVPNEDGVSAEVTTTAA